MAIQFRLAKSAIASKNTRDIFWRRPSIVSRALELASYVLLAIGLYAAVGYGINAHYLFVFGLFWLYFSLSYMILDLEEQPVHIGTADIKADPTALQLHEYTIGVAVLMLFQVGCLAIFFLSPGSWPFHEVFVYGVVSTIPVVVLIRGLRDRDCSQMLAGHAHGAFVHS